MSKIILLKGIPGSGKSTWAKEYVAKHPKAIRLNNDDLRIMIHDGKWSKSNEKIISKARQVLVEAFLLDGLTVIVDNLNLHEKHEKELRAVAETYGADFEVKDFPVDLEEAIKRDLQRANSVGERVIRQWWDYVKPKPKVYKRPKSKPEAILCDIDGTLAHMKKGGRSPYDWSRVGEDTVDEAVADIVRVYESEDVEIILVSGRNEVCRKQTEEWLEENDVPYDHLYMRPEGDNRKDTIIKGEIFENHVRKNYQVNFVLDDRNQVVELWRSLGLKCLQVDEGNF